MDITGHPLQDFFSLPNKNLFDTVANKQISTITFLLRYIPFSNSGVFIFFTADSFSSRSLEDSSQVERNELHLPGYSSSKSASI